MSAYSNRAVYAASGRASYAASSGRALYADAAPVTASASSRFFGSASYTGSTGWTKANYDAAQASALSAVKADTTLSSGPSEAVVVAGCRLYYSERAWCDHYATRWTFAIPSGKRGSITKLGLIARAGAARFWDFTEYFIYTAYDYAQWDDFGCGLKLFFSGSSTAYSSGDALYGGEADTELSFEDINAVHEAADREPLVGEPAANNLDVFPQIVIPCADAVDKVNDFSSDTIYLWAIITRPSLFPFLYSDPGSGIDSDFQCLVQLRGPRLLVSLN